MVDRAAETAVSLRRSDHPRLTLELALAEMAQSAARVPLAEIARRLIDLEARLGGEAPVESALVTPGSPSVKTAGHGSGERPSPAKPPSGPRPPRRAPRRRAACGRPSSTLCARVRCGCGERCTRPNSRERTRDGALRVKAGSGAGLLTAVLRDSETQTLFREILGGLGVKTPEVRIEGASKPAAPKPVEKAAAKAAPKAEPKAEPKAAAKAAPKAEPKPASATKAAKEPPAPEEKPAPTPAAKDTRSMGQLFNDEPMLQKALDMFDGEVLP